MDPKTDYECIIPPPCISNNAPGEQFAIPVEMGKWWFIETKPSPHDCENRLKKFLFNVQCQCDAYGLGNEKICRKSCTRSDRSELEALFVKAKKREVQYLIIGSPKYNQEDKNYHSGIKSFEQKYAIPTSHVMYESLTSEDFALGQNDLVENLVKKANMKLGGLNYRIKADESDEKVFGSNDLIVGVNINYYDLPISFIQNNKIPLGPTIAIIGYAANDLMERNAFTGDYIYCSKDPKIVLEQIEQMLYDVLSRYRNHTQECPRSVKVFLTVRDCLSRYRIFYQELRQLCEFVEEKAHFEGPVHLLTFSKDRYRTIRGEEKPTPGTLLRTYLTKYDGLAFEMITHWAPVKNGKGEYEARIGHYEVYCSSRRQSSELPFKQEAIEEVKDNVGDQNVASIGKPKSGFAQFGATVDQNVNANSSEKSKPAGFGQFGTTGDSSEKPKFAGFGQFGTTGDPSEKSKPAGFGQFGDPLANVNSTEGFNQVRQRPNFREEDCIFPGDQPMDPETEKEADVYYWSKMMHTLGHFHQLVSYPTSMPGPVRIAYSLSRRGVLILQHNLFGQPEVMDGEQKEVMEKLSGWTYKKSELRNQRFNA